MKNKHNDPPTLNMEEKILSAAEKLFLQNGYPLTSTTQIAKEAGCNQALVHYYFRTKENLFNTVLGEKAKRVFKEFLSLETGEGTFQEKLTRMIEIHYDTVRENADMVLFLITEFSHHPKMVEELKNAIGNSPGQALALFQKDLETEIRAGRIRPVSLPQLVLNIVSMNVFLFAIGPVFEKVWNLDQATMKTLMDERKKEIVNTVLLSLRP